MAEPRRERKFLEQQPSTDDLIAEIAEQLQKNADAAIRMDMVVDYIDEALEKLEQQENAAFDAWSKYDDEHFERVAELEDALEKYQEDPEQSAQIRQELDAINAREKELKEKWDNLLEQIRIIEERAKPLRNASRDLDAQVQSNLEYIHALLQLPGLSHPISE